MLVAASLLAIAPNIASAQLSGFGQNKVQYRTFQWRVLKGEHVDVYYYPAAERVARVALGYAEESLAELEQRFSHRVRERVPIIVYASHFDFEQTNILPFVPPEGILGVTEFLKRRVALPFRGSYSEFRHTVRHELVHVFQLSLAIQQVTLYPRARRAGTPLWWTEGLAEYLSSPQDSRDEMIVRELALNGSLPTIQQLGYTSSAIVYPVGGDLHHFLARRYGEWRVFALHDALWKHASFEQALAAVYGRSEAVLTREWHYDLRQRYFPAVAGRAPLALRGAEVAEVALKPVAVISGKDTLVAYLSPSTGYTNIYVRPVSGGRARVAVAGERSAEFESFHPFSSRMDARAGMLLFGSKFGDRDALFVLDVARRRVVGRYQFDSLVAVLSPAWSPDGRQVAFSGLTLGGISDLYVFDLESRRLSRITNDDFEDVDPVWLPGGSSLVFSSDRAPGGNDGVHNLYRVGVSGGVVTALTRGRWSDESPRWDERSGAVLFASDRDGTFNLYTVDSTGLTQRRTRFDGGAFDPAPIPGDGRVLVTGFSGLSWSVFAISPDSIVAGDTTMLAVAGAADTAWSWNELSAERAGRVSSAPYRRDFSLDFAAGGTSATPGFAAQGAQIYFSDLLGDHSVSVGIATFGSSAVSDIFDNLNADVFYLNQSRRLNWGAGAFRLAGTFYERDFAQVYRETSVGGYGVLRYPLSRFVRVEAQARLERSDRDDFANELVRGPQRREGVLASNFLSVVRDNSLWLDTGPIDGARMNLTTGLVSDVSHGAVESWLGTADIRRYVRTSQQSAFAFRAYGYVSEGNRPRAITIGGSWLLRGYPQFSLAGNKAWVGNAEWRFPITNFVTVGFPFGAIRFPQLQGAFFTDAGQSWYSGRYDPRVVGSAGLGLRTAIIPGLVLRFDMGRRGVLGQGSADSRIPDDFFRRGFADFFFGYNF